MTGDEAFGGMRRLSPCLRSAVGISDFPEKVKASLLTNEIFSKDVAKIRDRTCGGTADEPKKLRPTAYERDFFKICRKDSDRTRGETADEPKKSRLHCLRMRFFQNMSQRFGIERAEEPLTSIFALPCPARNRRRGDGLPGGQKECFEGIKAANETESAVRKSRNNGSTKGGERNLDENKSQDRKICQTSVCFTEF